MSRVIGDVLRDIKQDLSAREYINKKDFGGIIAVRVSADPRMATYYWGMLQTLKVLVPINGSSCRLDEDAMYAILGKTNGVEA